MKIKIKAMEEYKELQDKLLPIKSTPGAAGYDLKAAEAMTVYSMQKAIISCGFAIELEPGYEAQIRSRSGLAAKQNIFVLNSPATIDEDYRGELKVILFNLGQLPFTVAVGDRIAQLIPQAVVPSVIEWAEKLSDTRRGESGFGSTGVK